MPISIQEVKTDSCSMRWFSFGTGNRTCVILPGLSVTSVMGAADAIAQQYRIFAEDFTVYVFDRRTDLPPVYTIQEMARDTASAIQALGLKDIDLFGASQGGMMALVIAIEHPELIHKLALGSTCASVSSNQAPVLREWVSLAKQQDPAKLYTLFGEKIYPPAVFEMYRDTLLSMAECVTDEDLSRFVTLAEGTAGFDVTSDLPSIACPVLAIGSYDDAVLGGHSTLSYAGVLGTKPDFRLYMYRGYGHASFDTAPDYQERLFRFFKAD